MSYLLDIAGTNPDNRIANEYAFISPGRALKEPALIIPRVAPFFGGNLEIYTGENKTGRLLNESQDYYKLNPFIPVEQLLGKEFFYGIWIINPEVTGSLWMDYNTIGGNFTINEEDVFEKLLGMMTEQIHFDWSQITSKPQTYLPRFHTHKETDQPMPQLVVKTQELLNKIGQVLNIPVDTSLPGG